jgi:hypothetical protein
MQALLNEMVPVSETFSTSKNPESKCDAEATQVIVHNQAKPTPQEGSKLCVDLTPVLQTQTAILSALIAEEAAT